MRQYFDYGDVRDAVNSQMELQRQQVWAIKWGQSGKAACKWFYTGVVFGEGVVANLETERGWESALLLACQGVGSFVR